MTLALGCIADDYTGASDLANTLTRCGLRTVQTIGVPADDLPLPEVDAVVVSLKSRSIEASVAVERSRAAERWLRGRGVKHVGILSVEFRHARRGQFDAGTNIMHEFRHVLGPARHRRDRDPAGA